VGCGLAAAGALFFAQRQRRQKPLEVRAAKGRGKGSGGGGGGALPSPPRSKPLAHSQQSFAQFYGGGATMRENPLSPRAAKAARAREKGPL
jgi:hypothetical protein